MPADPLFYLFAVIAVVALGISKGGFGGSGALLAVPLMSLEATPFEAVGILLPILLVMDAVAVWSYRRAFDKRSLLYLIPGGLLGGALGWMMAAHVSADMMRLAIGALALVFVVHYHARSRHWPARDHNAIGAVVASTASGLTSFLAHSGGPPFQMYMVRLKMTPLLFAGTSTMFFAVMNFIKIGPYLALNQLTRDTLMTSAVLIPLAIASTCFGVFLARRMSEGIFYRVVFGLLTLVAIKLIWDGTRGLMA